MSTRNCVALLALTFGIPFIASSATYAASAGGYGPETPIYDPVAPTGAKIAGNLANPSKGRYNCCFGWPVNGPSATRQWLAVSFRPATDTTVKTIELPLSIQSGSNAVVITLNKNSGGIPGTTLATFNASSLPSFGIRGVCCALVTLTSSSGVAVTAGATYWIVVKTGSGSTFQGVWHANVLNQTGNQNGAIINGATGGSWALTSFKPGVGFAVFGP